MLVGKGTDGASVNIAAAGLKGMVEENYSGYSGCGA